MRYIILVVMLSISLSAFSLKVVDKKIKLLKESKSAVFKEIDIVYDPFVGYKKIVSTQTMKTLTKIRKKESLLRVVTILNKMAFISGRWYKKGEKIGGYKISKIYKNSVILRRGKKLKILKIKKDKNIIKIMEKDG